MKLENIKLENVRDIQRWMAQFYFKDSHPYRNNAAAVENICPLPVTETRRKQVEPSCYCRS